MYRGAAGIFIVDDPAAEVDLPDTYGVDDIPLVIQDKRFDDDGSLDDSAPFMSSGGVLGDTILVNGTYDPFVEATTTLVRFRVLNASNAPVYNLGFTDERRLWLVGSDSGLLERPHDTRARAGRPRRTGRGRSACPVRRRGRPAQLRVV